MDQKWFSSIALAIILLLVIGGAVYFVLVNNKSFSPQPTQAPLTTSQTSPTTTISNQTEQSENTSNIPADWKTWRSDVWGFSIKYPGKEDIYIKMRDELSGEDPGGFEYFLGVEENGILISPVKYEREFSLDSWLDKHIPLKPENIYNKQTIFINGRNAFQFDTKGDVGVKYEPYEGGSVDSLIGKDMRFVVVQGPDRFIVSWFPLANKYGANFFDIYSKMISSLVFVK